MRASFRRTDSAGPEPTLDLYDVAYLAGGTWRVAEAAVITLRERGAVTVNGPRVRAGAGEPEHPVERALTALCPHNRSLTAVLSELAGSGSVEEIGDRLVSLGLLSRSRKRLTHTGRRRLEAAGEEESVPSYVLDGPAAVPDRQLRRTVIEAMPQPSGLGRRLRRLGGALDDTGDGWGSDSGSGHGGGHSCGGGGGGGGND